ncbi:MAG: hypothetical protein WBD46_19550 [Acidobacteriaceae bacterium]
MSNEARVARNVQSRALSDASESSRASYLDDKGTLSESARKQPAPVGEPRRKADHELDDLLWGACARRESL